MVTYDLFAKHYDKFMGNRAEHAAQFQRLVKKYHPQAKTVLELACGTGSVLQAFEKEYDVSGLVLSAKMLAVTKRKIPSGHFLQQDMTSFKLDQKFDVILCVFDSINHLLKFSEWKKVFKKAHQHLNPNGVFIFDMNPEAKLQKLINEPPWAMALGKDVMMVDVTNAGRGVSNWNIKVFEHQRKNHYTLYEENIKEKAFPLDQVKKALALYRKVQAMDIIGKRLPTKMNRVVFVCQA